MLHTSELALTIALLSLVGVLVNALVSANSARKRRDLDAKLIELRSKFDQLNAVNLAHVQAQHSEKLKALEFDLTQSAASQDRVRDADSAALERTLETLNPSEVISFLREHDFGSAYDRNETTPVGRFLDMARRPDSEFLDLELEERRKSLIEVGEQLMLLLGQKTHPRKGTLNSVLPESLVNCERPLWVDENASEINDCATAFVDAFDDLVRCARSRMVGYGANSASNPTSGSLRAPSAG